MILGFWRGNCVRKMKIGWFFCGKDEDLRFQGEIWAKLRFKMVVGRLRASFIFIEQPNRSPIPTNRAPIFSITVGNFKKFQTS